MPAATPIIERLTLWQSLYPDPGATAESNVAARDTEARWLGQFVGRQALTNKEVRELVEWKFQSMPHRLARAGLALERHRWDTENGHIGTEELIRRALTSDDDLQALRILCVPGGGVYGFGPAMSSVVLAACRPDEFTVADSRALAALRALGVIPPGPESFRLQDWLPYLAICRRLASDCGQSLRYVDQALWVGIDPMARALAGSTHNA